MSLSVQASNVGTAWLQAFDALMRADDRQLVNLVVTINDPLEEDRGVRAALEEHLACLARAPGRRRGARTQDPVHSVHTVANTIFPISLYQPAAPDAAARFFRTATTVSSRHGSHWGSYIGRLLSYQRPDGKSINQLERFLAVLSEETNYKDRYEAVVSYPGEALHDAPALDYRDATGSPATSNEPPDVGSQVGSPSDARSGPAGDLHLIGPADRRTRGGPCMAHLSLTLIGGRLHMTALYRRHHYIARAYGNFLGLARLLNFLARESGHEVGELTVVGTHALVDAGHISDLWRLHEEAHQRVGDTRAIEVATRPLGATWRDLDLPDVPPTASAVLAMPVRV